MRCERLYKGCAAAPASLRGQVWNHEFAFLVEDPGSQVWTGSSREKCGELTLLASVIPLIPVHPISHQVLEIQVCDSHMTGRVDVGSIRLALSELPLEGAVLGRWVKLQV